MWKEFRAFATRGNVVDMAVGVIIGAAFGKIVTSLVNDLLMPPLGMVLGKMDFKALYVALDGKTYENLDAAKKANAPLLAYGSFLQTVFDFVLVAFVIFIVVKQMNKLMTQLEPKPADAGPTTKECPHCCSTINVKATRCAHCTAQL
ncbi:MAG: large-conductance mechanosensitive channel protein MscL [Verrucomicrobia bacterium]|nr:large-conductance mechanosensitive channel protein MscL [Verrucomicrobiota bacterium]